MIEFIVDDTIKDFVAYMTWEDPFTEVGTCDNFISIMSEINSFINIKQYRIVASQKLVVTCNVDTKYLIQAKLAW